MGREGGGGGRGKTSLHRQYLHPDLLDDVREWSVTTAGMFCCRTRNLVGQKILNCVRLVCLAPVHADWQGKRGGGWDAVEGWGGSGGRRVVDGGKIEGRDRGRV